MEPFPASPEPEHHPQSRGAAPASVTTAVKFIWASVALGIVSALLTLLSIDDLVADSVAAAGATGVSEDAARTGVIIGLVIGLVISVGLAALFAYFIGRGANWARIVYTVLAVFSIISGLVGLGGLPPLLLVVSLVSLALSIAIVFFLFRPESNAYFKKERFAS